MQNAESALRDWKKGHLNPGKEVKRGAAGERGGDLQDTKLSQHLQKWEIGRRELLTKYAFFFQYFFCFRYILICLFALIDLSEPDCDASSLEDSVDSLMSEADASDSEE